MQRLLVPNRVALSTMICMALKGKPTSKAKLYEKPVEIVIYLISADDYSVALRSSPVAH